MNFITQQPKRYEVLNRRHHNLPQHAAQSDNVGGISGWCEDIAWGRVRDNSRSFFHLHQDLKMDGVCIEF